jgi:hypothetical protein
LQNLLLEGEILEIVPRKKMDFTPYLINPKAQKPILNNYIFQIERVDIAHALLKCTVVGYLDIHNKKRFSYSNRTLKCYLTLEPGEVYYYNINQHPEEDYKLFVFGGKNKSTKKDDETKKAAEEVVAGELANKDGKYGKKNEGWTGTIEYEGVKATVSNAEFELKNGRIIWTDGVWHNGNFTYGTWKNGMWEDGIWEVGEWENGIWKNGTWKYGTWQFGIWYNGKWENGTWKNGTWNGGVFLDGWWEKGIWENGIWNGGTFWKGNWNNGTWNNGILWYGIWENGTWNSGTWNEGIWNGGIWKGGYDRKENWHPADASPNKWTKG